MPPDHPSLILETLDSFLRHPVELTIFGKAALWLGFDGAPASFGATLDVDAIVPLRQSEALDQDTNFWTARDATNEALLARGLYVTHIFEERQIILRRDWVSHRVRLPRPRTRHLELYRPATLDLLLTKMMRGGDAVDLQDIAFIIHCDELQLADIEAAISSAVVPNVPEICELFDRAKSAVIELARRECR